MLICRLWDTFPTAATVSSLEPGTYAVIDGLDNCATWTILGHSIGTSLLNVQLPPLLRCMVSSLKLKAETIMHCIVRCAVICFCWCTICKALLSRIEDRLTCKRLRVESNRVFSSAPATPIEGFYDMKSVDDVTLNIIYKLSSDSNKNYCKPPLLFIHGSYHGNWAYDEHFLRYFSSQGYDSYAISLRGTSKSPVLPGIGKVYVDDHLRDLYRLLRLFHDRAADFPSSTKSTTTPKPIIIAHSLGGVISLKLLADDEVRRLCGGLCLMCSVPPTGNGRMSLRYLRRSLGLFWKIFSGFVFKSAIKDASVCRDLFFDDSFSDELVERYRCLMESDSRAPIDISDLNKKWPSKDSSSIAPWLSLSESVPKRLVIGGERDLIVDREGVEETAAFLGVQPVWLNVTHDLMLGEQWTVSAKAINAWLEEFN